MARRVGKSIFLQHYFKQDAKLKDNNKYRFRSMLVFSAVVSFSVNVIFLIFMAPLWNNILVIDGIDMTLELVRALVLPLYLSPLFFAFKLSDRYGLTVK